MANNDPALLVFGAHPDDCEITTGGLAALYAERGWRAMFVSLTNGDAGHHEIGGAALARRRKQEACAAADVIGIESLVLDNHDGELLPTLDRRREVIGIIRDFRPDLILTPRPYDYHPDHRYTATLVQDAAYMITVPNICASHEIMKANPVIMYVRDGFLKPYPFAPDIAIDIDKVIEKKVDMLHCHTSQMYEWLPYNAGHADEVPDDPAEHRVWMRGRREARLRSDADMFREMLISRYGQERGSAIAYAEAFELCEYGASLTKEAASRLFPF